MSDARQISIGVDGHPPGSLMGVGAGSEDPAISPDGNLLVFSSTAENLAPGFDQASSESPNIFITHLNSSSSAIELISVNKSNRYPEKVVNLNLLTGSINPSISRILYTNDGEIDSYAVAFTSDAQDLVPDYVKPSVGSPNPRQVYLRLPRQGQTVLVSRATGLYDALTLPRQGANQSSEQPSVALLAWGPGQDTTYRVVFRSSATDLSSTESPGPQYLNNIVYWRDISRNTLGEIIVGPVIPVTVNPEVSINEFSISHDGSKLAFVASGAVIEGKNSEKKQVYVFDFTTRDFWLISRTNTINNTQPDSYSPANQDSGHPSLSFTGTEIGFLHYANGGTNLVSVSGNKPLMVMCNVPTQVYDSVFCSQVNTDADGNPSSGEAKAGRIDASGRYVVFSDTGENLRQKGESGEDQAQVYLKDLHPDDDDDEKPVYLASKKNGQHGAPLASGQERQSLPLSSRPPVAVGVSNGQVRVAFSSWSENLAEVGRPSQQIPYLFASELVSQSGPTPTPASTPTPTPTPTPTHTNAPPGSANEDDPRRDENEGDSDNTDPDAEEGALPTVDLRAGVAIDVPAKVEVIRAPGEKTATIIITLPEVRIDPKLFEKLSRADNSAMAAVGARIRYEVEIRKAGSRKRITRTSSRNVVTVRKLLPGRYTVRYRISASKGKRTIRSRQSPPTTIVIT